MLTHLNVAHVPQASRKVCSFMLIRGLQAGQVTIAQGNNDGHGTSGPAALSSCPGRPHRFWAADRPLLIAVPGGIEGYFHQINATATDDDRIRIGERHGIHVVPE